MHIKRLLAVFLSAAMFITSGFSTYAVADTEFAVEASTEVSSEETDEAAGEASLEEQKEEKASGEATPEKQKEEMQEETPAAASEEDTEEKNEEAAAEETTTEAEVPDGEKDASDDASSEGTSDENSEKAGETEEVEEAGSEEAGSEEADVASTEDSIEEELIIEEDKVDLVGGNYTNKSPFLDTENGVLKIKDGYTKNDFSATVYIPKETTLIPAGIFDSDNSQAKFIKFQNRDTEDTITIASHAFEGSLIETIELCDKVTVIEEAAFRDASSLTKVTGLDHVEAIPNDAFSGTALVSVSGAKVKTVGDRAFSGCSSLRSVSFPSLVSIGKTAFNNCSSLDSSFVFADSLVSIGSNAFNGCNLTTLDLTNITAETLTFGTQAFEGNKNLTTVKLPNGVKTIPTRLFYGCSSLYSVSIGLGVEKIDSFAFGNCASLKNVVTQNVTNFVDKSFAGCNALETVVIKYMNPLSGDSAGIFIGEEAFPAKPTLTLKGYDGDVKTYAQKRGYKFETLFPAHSVKIADYDTSKVTINRSTELANSGDTVQISVTPKEGYVLKNIVVSGDDDTTDISLVKIDGATQIFEFLMPNANVKVEATMAAQKEAVSGELGHMMKPVDGYTCDPGDDDRSYVFDKAGRRAQLVIKVAKQESASWLWNFSSSDTSKVVVNSEGIIRAVKAGSAKITATAKSDDSKKVTITVSVLASTKIRALEWNINTPKDAIREADVTIDGKAVPVYVFDKSVLDSGSVKFKAEIKAFPEGDDSGRSLMAVTNWKSVDTSIATVASAKSDTNANTITLKKGAVGETMITVSVTNEGEKTAADIRNCIIKVIDTTPRLENGKITVNSLSTVGTQLDIVTVYGAEIASELTFVYRSTDKNKVTTETYCMDLNIEENDGKFYAVNAAPGNAFTATYKGKNQLYIKGRYENGSSKFYIPVPELTVVKTMPNPTIKTSGKINLFYNNDADPSECGEFKITQNVKNVATNIDLICNEKYKNPNYTGDDKFANNFEIERVDDQNYTITRTENPMAKDNGKDVVSGYLKITYDGYTTPVYKPIKVATYNSAPQYVLSMSKATANINSSDQVYRIKLLDKKTKKEVPELLSNLDTDKVDGNYKGLRFDAATVDAGVFEDIEDEGVINEAKDNNYIPLTVIGKPKACKATFFVKLKSWDQPQKFTFTLKTTSSLPAVKMDASTVTLNKSYKSRTATITFSDNQDEAKITMLSKPEYTGNKKYAEGAAALANLMSVGEDKVTVKLPENVSEIAETTYTFRTYPTVSYENSGRSIKLTKPVTFKVTVVKKTPSIKLKNGTFTFNDEYAGVETVSTAYTIGNLPTGQSGSVDANNAELKPVGNAPDDLIQYYNFDDGILDITLSDIADAYVGKSFKYNITGLKVESGDDEEVVPDFKITVKIRKAQASVKIKATGSINPVDATSNILATATVSNVVSEVATVSIKEKDANGVYYKDEDKKPYSKHFYLKPVEGHPEQVRIMMKTGLSDDEKVKQGKKYNITLDYELEAGGKAIPVYYTVTPKQIIPNIKVGASEATIYAGQSERIFVTTVETVPGKTAATTVNAVLENVTFANGTDASLKKAFSVTYDPSTKKMTVTLVNPSAIVMNKTYTLNLVTEYINQAGGSTANKFAIKVTVKK
ncbi:MAG: hypothetical protein E7307_09540 [Butyrivibrio sp.]|nr:hypothetical protein [Butyrivibrio sp.]